MSVFTGCWSIYICYQVHHHYSFCWSFHSSHNIYLWILLIYSPVSGVLGTVYPLLMAAGLGIGDGVLMTQLSALLAIFFTHDTEGAFAQLKVWQSGTIAAVFFISPYISLQAMLVVTLVTICRSWCIHLSISSRQSTLPFKFITSKELKTTCMYASRYMSCCYLLLSRFYLLRNLLFATCTASIVQYI